jgi:DNA-directed RNA polymerase subunit RPC12/RpoP
MIVKFIPDDEWTYYCSKCGKDLENPNVYSTEDETGNGYDIYCKKCAKKICNNRGIKLPKEIK